jgi:membrane-associated phospholipid phosphatase
MRPWLGALVLGCSLVAAAAQAPASSGSKKLTALPDAPQPQTAVKPRCDASDVTLRDSLRILLCDQGAIWTSPVRLRAHDLEWVAPLALASGVAIATDHRTMSQVVSHNPGFNHANVVTSNALISLWIAAPVAVFGYGHFEQDDRARETGILSAESIVDAQIVLQGAKLVFRRERPNVDDSRGRFFKSSAIDSSFPSGHSMTAWAVASAFAAESSSPWTRFALYSGATGVGLTRIMGQKHFPSDVLVGSATGWLLGHYVVKRHHKSRE